MISKKDIYENIFRVLVWIILIVSCLPFLRAASLSTFKADDFSTGISYFKSDKNLLQFAASSAVNSWKNWQGTYAGTFWGKMFSPMYKYSYRQLRITMLTVVTLAIVGLFLAIHALFKHFFIKRKFSIYATALILLPLLIYREYHEIYLWYSGATTHLFPIIAGEFALVLLINWGGLLKSKKTIYGVLSIPFVFTMVGCSMEETGFWMWFLLMFVAIDWLYNGRINKGFICLYILALAGALLNALAPGNYIRQNASVEYVERYSLFTFAAASCKVTFQESLLLHSHSSFLIFEALAVILGIKVEKEINISILLVAVLGALILPAVTIFPVMFGLNQVEHGFSNRCYFIFDVAIIICFISLAFIAGVLIKQSEKPVYYVLTPLLIAAIILSSFRNESRSVIARLIENFSDNSIYSVAAAQKDAYNSIKYSNEEDVVLSYLPEDNIGNTRVDIKEDADYFVNKEIASYFGKESVVYMPGE